MSQPCDYRVHAVCVVSQSASRYFSFCISRLTISSTALVIHWLTTLTQPILCVCAWANKVHGQNKFTDLFLVWNEHESDISAEAFVKNFFWEESHGQTEASSLAIFGPWWARVPGFVDHCSWLSRALMSQERRANDSYRLSNVRIGDKVVLNFWFDEKLNSFIM